MGADINMTNNMLYQTAANTKFYNFYIEASGKSSAKYSAILKQLGFTGRIDLTPLQ